MSVVESAMAGGRKEVALAAIAVLTAVRLRAHRKPWIVPCMVVLVTKHCCARLRALNL